MFKDDITEPNPFAQHASQMLMPIHLQDLLWRKSLVTRQPVMTPENKPHSPSQGEGVGVFMG